MNTAKLRSVNYGFSVFSIMSLFIFIFYAAYFAFKSGERTISQNSPAHKEPKTRSPKTTAKLIQNNVYCFFITIFRLAIPAFFRFTDVTEPEHNNFTFFSFFHVNATAITMQLCFITLMF